MFGTMYKITHFVLTEILMTKKELTHVFDISGKTLRRWVQRIQKNNPELFTMEQYDACRVLPPRIALAITHNLGL